MFSCLNFSKTVLVPQRVSRQSSKLLATHLPSRTVGTCSGRWRSPSGSLPLLSISTFLLRLRLLLSFFVLRCKKSSSPPFESSHRRFSKASSGIMANILLHHLVLLFPLPPNNYWLRSKQRTDGRLIANVAAVEEAKLPTSFRPFVIFVRWSY